MEKSKKPWPKVWEHKKKKTRVRVMPWWECLDPILADDNDFGALACGVHQTEGRKFRIGSIVQIGWLIESTEGVWFGVAPETQKQFTEIKS